MAKINISIDDNLLERIDKFAEENYMSRSGLFSMATAQYLNSNEVILFVKDMSLAMRKIADSGEIDDVTMAKLEDFERVCKMLVGK